MIFERLLEDFKKANTAAKEKLAAKFGFSTPEDYLKYLEGALGINSSPTPQGKPIKKPRIKPAKVVERITVHNVHILDASGSMRGSKFTNAVNGINTEVLEMRKDDSTEVTQTVVHFSDPNDIQISLWKTPLREVGYFMASTRGCTALLETLGNTLTRLLAEANGKDKVLVKIFTDGQENATPQKSPWKNPMAVANLIKACEDKGFTITFVGTAEDVEYVTNLLKIDITNTLAHDNTAEGIAKSYKMSTEATALYRSDASRGIDVKSKFFSKRRGTL